MEHVGSLTDYEKLKKAEMAVVSVWPYVQKHRHCAEHYSAGVFDWNTHGDSLGSEL